MRKKIVVSVILTILVMLQLFYYVLINARVNFGYTIDGRQIVSVDLGIQEFNYWEEVK